jgi:hypothetical protein
VGSERIELVEPGAFGEQRLRLEAETVGSELIELVEPGAFGEPLGQVGVVQELPVEKR